MDLDNAVFVKRKVDRVANQIVDHPGEKKRVVIETASFVFGFLGIDMTHLQTRGCASGE